MTAHTQVPEDVAVPGRNAWTTRRLALAAACVFIFASLLYLTTLRNGFVWDDLVFIENPDIRSLDVPMVKHLFGSNYWDFEEANSGLYRPLSALSLHIDYQLYGHNPPGFHFTNVLLNAAVCALFFLLLCQLFARPDVAFLAALFFAAFPTHVENVAWVSGRTDLIATLLTLASLCCYVLWRRSGRVFGLLGAPICFGAALLAKESAVILPVLVVATELAVLRRRTDGDRGRRGAVLMLASLFVIAALYMALRTHVLGAAVSHFTRFSSGPVQGIALSFSILAHYVFKLLFPLRLTVEADFPPPTGFVDVHVLAGVLILLATFFALYRWRQNTVFVFGTAVILIGLAPVLNILPVNQIAAERFLYFPSAGFALLVSAAALGAPKRRRAILIAFVAVVVVFSVRTVARTLDWKDDLTLFEKTVATNGDNARARANLGSSYYQRERYLEAEKEYRRATELNPGYAGGWSGLSKTSAKLGHADEALEYMENAIALRPNNVLFLNELGMLEFRSGDYTASAATFRRALELQPRQPHARFNLGLALYQLRDFEGAVQAFSELENKDTDFVNAYLFLAESEAQRGNRGEAARYAARFLSLHPDDDAVGRRARELAAPGP